MIKNLKSWFFVFGFVILGNSILFSQQELHIFFDYKKHFNQENVSEEVINDLDYLFEEWHCILDREEYIFKVIQKLENRKQIQFLNILIAFNEIRLSNKKKVQHYLAIVESDKEIYHPGIYYFTKVFQEYAVYNYSNSINYINETIKFYAENGNNLPIIYCYTFLIKIYGSLGDIETSAEYYSKAIILSEKENHKRGVAIANRAFAIRMSQYDTDYSNELFLKAAEMYGDTTNNLTYETICSSYLRFLIKYKGREVYIKQFQKIRKEIDFENSCNYHQLGVIYTIHAHYHSLVNDYDSALYYNKKALEIRRKYFKTNLIGSSYMNLCNNYIYLNKPDSATIMLDSAKFYLNKYSIRNLVNQRNYLNHKIKLFKKLGYKDSVLITYNNLVNVTNEYNIEQQQALTKNLEAKNSLNIKLQKEKYELELSKKRNNLIYLTIISVLTSIVIIFLIVKLRKRNLHFRNLVRWSKMDKIALEEYQNEIQQLKEIFENAPKGFLIVDAFSKINYFNESAHKMFSRNKRLEVGTSFYNYISDFYLNTTKNAMRVASESKENQEVIIDYNDVFYKKQKVSLSISPMNANREEGSLLLIATDITESENAFEREKKQLKVLQTLINSVTESILLIDNKYQIQLLNNTAASRLGDNVEDLIGKNYLEIIPKRVRDFRQAKLEEVFLTKSAKVFDENVDSYHTMISYYPNVNTDGDIEFVAEFTQDITERKIASEQINSLRQKVLRSQMNPHFIFNSLNAIQSYVLKNDSFKAVKYLNSFAKLIRMILDSSRYDYITLTKEVDILKYYLDLQQLRFGDKFVHKLEIDKNLDTDSLLIPAMLAQPFIENAIEHGLQHLETKGTVRISFIRKIESIVFKVIDNGIGRDASMKIQENNKHKNASLSTQLFKERLYTLNRFSGKKITYNIVDLKDDIGTAKGTMVIIHLPLIYKTDVGLN